MHPDSAFAHSTASLQLFRFDLMVLGKPSVYGIEGWLKESSNPWLDSKIVREEVDGVLTKNTIRMKTVSAGAVLEFALQRRFSRVGAL